MLAWPSDPQTHWSPEVPSSGRKRTKKWDRGFNRVFHLSVRKNWIQKRPRFWDHDLLRCVNFFGPAAQAAARRALTERVRVSSRGGDETSSTKAPSLVYVLAHACTLRTSCSCVSARSLAKAFPASALGLSTQRASVSSPRIHDTPADDIVSAARPLG